MTFLATTRVAILRGSTENTLGDTVESNDDASIVPVLTDVPASLVERSKNVYDPASGTRRTVRVIICRLPAAVPHPVTGARTAVVVLDGDRIKDKTTGNIYALNEATGVPRALSGQSSLTLDLRATASAISV